VETGVCSDCRIKHICRDMAGRTLKDMAIAKPFVVLDQSQRMSLPRYCAVSCVSHYTRYVDVDSVRACLVQAVITVLCLSSAGSGQAYLCAVVKTRRLHF
jgi:hypothetical protein